MNCPFIGKNLPEHPLGYDLRIRDIAICKTCGGSVVLSDGEPRQAAHADWAAFSDTEMAQLTRARALIVRPDRFKQKLR